MRLKDEIAELREDVHNNGMSPDESAMLLRLLDFTDTAIEALTFYTNGRDKHGMIARAVLAKLDEEVGDDG